MKNLILGGFLVGLCAGCGDVRESIGDSVVSIQTRTAAAAAWKDSTDVFKGVDHEQHFADGFKAGYYRAAIYGEGGVPPVPSRYSGSAFRSRRGQQRVQAWRDGYAHGASFAMEDVAADEAAVEATGSLEPVGYEAAGNNPGRN